MEKRGRPLFSHELWNQVKIIGGETGDTADQLEVSCTTTTNNTLESYNGMMKLLLGPNPDLWKTLQSLVSQEAETRRILMNNAAGLDLTVNSGRKQLLMDSNTRLQRIVQRISDLSPEVYLRTLANHLNISN
jgi:hypothetical protein